MCVCVCCCCMYVQCVSFSVHVWYVNNVRFLNVIFNCRIYLNVSLSIVSVFIVMIFLCTDWTGHWGPAWDCIKKHWWKNSLSANPLQSNIIICWTKWPPVCRTRRTNRCADLLPWWCDHLVCISAVPVMSCWM